MKNVVNKEQVMQEVFEGVVERDSEAVVSAINKAVAEGIDPMSIVENGLTKGMEVVGEKFEKAEYFLPDLLIASLCVQDAMKVLKPLMTYGSGEQVTFVMGTVEGDIHDIGKNLVITTLEATGFNVIDLGVSVSAQSFVDAVKKYSPDLVGISALITTTMVNMKDIVDALVESGVRNKVKVIVGGAPLDEKFAKTIGADYYGRTVRDAIVVGREIKEAK